jgi:hypothetical protein
MQALPRLSWVDVSALVIARDRPGSTSPAPLLTVLSDWRFGWTPNIEVWELHFAKQIIEEPSSCRPRRCSKPHGLRPSDHDCATRGKARCTDRCCTQSTTYSCACSHPFQPVCIVIEQVRIRASDCPVGELSSRDGRNSAANYRRSGRIGRRCVELESRMACKVSEGR